ncbi:MAG: hypothetical protein JNJ85_14520, partial [Candidatus Kapabacteria bacterium]|nr:hypothetical protein [Candidatus Kapabacteria bacterium]
MRDTISYSFSVIGYNGNFKDSVFGNFKINKRESNIFKYVDLKKVKYDNLTSDTKNLPHYVATFCNDNLKNLYIQLDATFGYIKFDTTWNIYKTDYNKDGGSTYWHMQVDSKNTAWVQNFNSSGLMKHDGKFWSYIDAQTFSKDAGLGRGTI